MSVHLQKKKKKFSGGRQGGFQGWVVVGRVKWWLLPTTADHRSYIPEYESLESLTNVTEISITELP